MPLHLAFVVLLLAVAGCEKGVLGAPLSEATLEQLEASGELSTADQALLARYLKRTGMETVQRADDPAPAPLTVGEAIALQREWERAEALATGAPPPNGAEDEAPPTPREATLERLRQSVRAEVTEKRYEEGEYGRADVVLTVALRNAGTRDLQGIKGTLVFLDLFDDPVVYAEVKHDAGLAAGRDTALTRSYRFNRYIEAHGAWRDTPLDRMTAVWEPEVLIFSDGDREDAPAPEHRRSVLTHGER